MHHDHAHAHDQDVHCHDECDGDGDVNGEVLLSHHLVMSTKPKAVVVETRHVCYVTVTQVTNFGELGTTSQHVLPAPPKQYDLALSIHPLHLRVHCLFTYSRSILCRVAGILCSHGHERVWRKHTTACHHVPRVTGTPVDPSTSIAAKVGSQEATES